MTSSPITIETHLVEVRALSTMVEACRFDNKGSGVNRPEQFPVLPEHAGCWEFSEFLPTIPISTEEAVRQINLVDTNNPWQPARIAHLLVYSRKHFNVSVAALGSIGKYLGKNCAPVYHSFVPERNLVPYDCNFPWEPGFIRLLMVRPVK